MRKARIERKTSETDIKLSLDLDGTGKRSVDTGIGFFDHMLELFAKHGLFDIDITVKGDTRVDEHHTVEDTGIALGEAFLTAAGDKSGICRYASQFVPMDEALCFACADISGRPFLRYEVFCPDESVGGLNPRIFEEFFRAFSSSAKITLHIESLEGANTHHIIESVFKAAARALRFALEKDDRAQGVPSTKGVL